MKDYNNFRKFNFSVELKTIETFLSNIQAEHVLMFCFIASIVGVFNV
jgi:ABC-type antimicrobial peptide transport system permease subunit